MRIRKNKELSIVIPCLNEEETIEVAMEKASEAGKKYLKGNFELIVADNGSTDGSIEIVKKRGIARLIHVPVRGYGAALHWGILNAKKDYVLFADADLSYDFSELRKFLRFFDKDYDLVLGSRLTGKIEKGAMPFLNRYVGTPFLTTLIRFMYGLKTTDCNSGMRMIKKSFYKKLHMRNSGMEWASELLLKTALAKGKYGEVPINFHKDKRGAKPHLLRWADGWRHLKAIVLIKPNYLFLIVILFGFLAIYFIKRSFDLTFFFALLSGSLFLSVLAAKILNFAIDNVKSRMVAIINKLPLVMGAMILTTLSFIALLFIPNRHLGTKLFLVSAVIIFDGWVFLIETIKTHLINSLKKNEKN